MREIRVLRTKLLVILRANRQDHYAELVKAQAKYRELMIQELDKRIAEARQGGPILRAFMLPEPQNHTEDFDRSISMLEMEVREEVELSEAEFRRYVQNRWEWAESWNETARAYGTKAMPT